MLVRCQLSIVSCQRAAVVHWAVGPFLARYGRYSIALHYPHDHETAVLVAMVLLRDRGGGLIVAEGTVFAPEIALAMGVSVSLLASAALVAGIVYARNFMRAFCIGASSISFVVRLKLVSSELPGMLDPGDMSLTAALFPLAQWWFTIANANSYGIEFCLHWLFAIAGGLVAVFVRWLTLDNSPRHEE